MTLFNMFIGAAVIPGKDHWFLRSGGTANAGIYHHA